MAKIYPLLESIKQQKVSPTEGELKILIFFKENLSDEYEVYFQPYLNGDNPDIIVVRKGGGVLIIEVKDWNINAYELDKKNDWLLKNNLDVKIKSPFHQVNTYKENLYNIHSEELFLKNINNSNAWSLVQCAVYFHKEYSNDIHDFLLQNTNSLNYEKYKKWINYFHVLGKNDLNKEGLESLLNKSKINQNSSLFSEDIYISILRYLKHPLHVIEDGKIINYTKAQIQLSESSVVKQKIKSAAGCGKTLVLAKRAVNSHKRTNDKVLILTYNLTLINYIRDRINEVREEFNWSNFEIINYHQFFKSQANNYGLTINSLDDFDNDSFFEKISHSINKYKTILIDEIQDYKQQWLDIIINHFSDDDTELVVFGDEKQNIYERDLDESNNIKISKIPGAWNKSLNQNFRSKNEIIKLTNDFQQNFFNSKYSIEDTELQTELQFDHPIIQYYDNVNIDDLHELIFKIIKENKIHSSDCGILSSQIKEIRDLDYFIRTRKNENTTRMFETFEYNKIFNEKYPNPIEKNKIVGQYRRMKKINFWMNTGLIKLSTIQSFKGWEIDTLFLLINKDCDTKVELPELVYTGLTRARNNLFIINLGNQKFANFFKNYKVNLEENKSEITLQKDIVVQHRTKSNNNFVVNFDQVKCDTWEEIQFILEESSKEEIDVLNKILKNTSSKNSKELIQQFKDLGSPKILKDSTISYYELLKNCANHLNVFGNTATIKDLEQNISQIYLKNIIDKLSPEQRNEFEKELLYFSSSKGYGKEISSLAALAGAQLSGFGVYLAASAVVGGITSAVGVTLPFAFYTSMSSVISTIIGPVGWIGLAGVALYKYNKVDYNKVLPPLIYIIYLKYKNLNKL